MKDEAERLAEEYTSPYDEKLKVPELSPLYPAYRHEKAKIQAHFLAGHASRDQEVSSLREERDHYQEKYFQANGEYPQYVRDLEAAVREMGEQLDHECNCDYHIGTTCGACVLLSKHSDIFSRVSENSLGRVK
jgi:hypothetical protein